MKPKSERSKPFANSKQILLILVLTFFIAFSISATHIIVSAPDLPVHNINTGNNYATIQEAINAPETLDGHTILVDPGMYNENVIVNKSVRLHGASQSTTIIDGNGAEKVVSLTVSGAEIAGFTVQNGSRGINLDGIQNANVTENYALSCSYAGIFVSSCSKCVILNNTTTSTNEAGIYLWESVENSIINNTIADTSHGMWLLVDSTNNIISSNFVSNSPQGIVASINCNSNIIIGNTATSSSLGGIVMGGAYNNTIYHNNIEHGIYTSYGDSVNFWDDGTEGNFWKDYPGPDLDEDGIGDTPYTIDPDTNNSDNHPLMGIFTDFNVNWQEENHHVYVISNSTISDFDFKVTYEPEERKAISFNVTGEDGSVGFCRVMFPRVLVTYPYTVLVNGENANITILDISNTTHAYLYFTYETTTKHVRIVPEIPSSVILPLFMIFAVFAAVSSKKKTLSSFHNVYIRDWKRNFYTHTKQKLIEKGFR